MHIEGTNIKNRFYNYYFANYSQRKKKETKNISIDEKNYKDLVIYFTRYVHSIARKTLSLYYHELLGKVKIHKEKKYLVIDDYVLVNVLNKINK